MTNTIQRLLQTLKRVPLYGWIIGGALFLIGMYSLIFFIPKQVQFSYAQETCVGQLTLAPGLHKANSDSFTITLNDELKIGNWAFASTKTCFTPVETLDKGNYVATTSPWGSIFAQKRFNVSVPEAPSVVANSFGSKKISTVTPLQIALNSPDAIHTYTLKTEEEASECQQQQAKLSCATADLKLRQGQAYTLGLYRTVNKESSKLLESKVETLDPLKQTESSLTADKVIYDTTKQFTFTFDKSLESAKVEVKTVDGGVIATKSSVNGNTLAVTAEKDLPRKTSFTLTINQAIAQDGSSLEAPLKINFSTSGGPKVASVSVGASNVGQSARIVLTFDQPIHESVVVTKIMRATGVNATVSKVSATQVAVQLQSAPLCANFSIVIDKGVKSGSNNESSEEAWNFASRTTCGVSSVIGYSVRGRAIVVHYFGNGNKTILITGGIHGSEPSGYTTTQALVNYLYANGQKIPADKRIVIVPNANPDGIATGARYNANNVNLDRNFPSASWKPDIETASGIIKNGGGTSALSEPEARALYNLTLKLRPWLEVSFHAQGSLVGANQIGNSTTIGSSYARTVGYGTMFGNAEEVMGYPITGEYEEWMGEVGIPAILIELPRHSGNYFNAHLPALQQIFAL